MRLPQIPQFKKTIDEPTNKIHSFLKFGINDFDKSLHEHYKTNLNEIFIICMAFSTLKFKKNLMQNEV